MYGIVHLQQKKEGCPKHFVEDCSNWKVTHVDRFDSC